MTMPLSTPIRAILFDLAGTTIDFGSSAPAATFVELFAKNAVSITTAEARLPMGTAKRDHIALLAAMPRVADAWQAAHGRRFSTADLDRLYADFIPLQRRSLSRFDELIPGTLTTISALRAAGLSVVVTTGYDEALATVVLEAARRQGFVPDAAVCASEVPAGRPAPWMIFRAMEKVNVWPPAAVVAVGDTIVDIEAARNAGVWGVGVAATGNMLGLGRHEYESLEPAYREELVTAATAKMMAAGAHAVAESIAEVPAILDAFEGQP